jgi:proline dehydrogenase
VGAILDYAAEDDVGPTTAAAASSQSGGASADVGADAPGGPAAGVGADAPGGPAAGAQHPPEPSARALGVVGRTYDYASEEQCDRYDGTT